MRILGFALGTVGWFGVGTMLYFMGYSFMTWQYWVVLGCIVAAVAGIRIGEE